MVISAVTGEGISEFVRQLADLVARARNETVATSNETVIHRLKPQGVEIKRLSDGSWAVLGREALRCVAVNDINATGAAEHIAGGLRRLGVEKALRKSGAHEGDVVHVGDFSFTYEPD